MSNVASLQNTELLLPEIKAKLINFLQSNGIANYSSEVCVGTNKGDNYLGTITKVSIIGTDENGDEKKHNWMVKTAPGSEALRMTVAVDDLYQREVYVYEKVIPVFKQFETERGVLDSFAVTPPLVLSYMEPLKESFVMEDLKVLGFTMKDRLRPLEYAHVKTVMKAYGRLHALSYALRDQKPELFEDLARNTKEKLFTEARVTIREAKMYQRFYTNKVMKIFDAKLHAREIEGFKKYAEKSVEIIVQIMKDGAANPYSVIGHGDGWVNNMLFKYEDVSNPSIPTDVCLLDWQLARYGSPALDLSYFLFICTDKKLRDRHYDNLLKLYYYSLSLRLVELGTDPQKVISYEAIQSEMRTCAVFGLNMALPILYVVTSEAEDIPDWESYDEYDDGLKMMDYESRNEEMYNRRVRDIVTDFVEKGYFDHIK